MDILIVRNSSNPKAIDASLLLAAYLTSQGIGHVAIDTSELSVKNEAKHQEMLAEKNVEMAVVLGGDGTILRSARLANPLNIPILGINFGNLGFLANSGEDGVVAIVAAALAGDVVCEQRTNLRVQIFCENDDPGSFRESSLGSFFALNEVALTRGADGRIIDFNLNISDASLARMRGDGLVVATATGSSAYALSAGGPLVSPSFNGLVVVPLAPHTLQSRAVVTAPHDIVEVDLSNNETDREVALFIDGELVTLNSAPLKIWIQVGKTPTKLLNYKRQDFYKHAAEVFFGQK